MPLHPALEKMLMKINGKPRFAGEVPTVEELRREIASVPMVPEEKRTQVFKIENRTIPGPGGHLPIRIYTPDRTGPMPLLVFFHGGGFVIGDIEGNDPLCRRLAKTTGHIVVSVGYRLAPEHPFPAGPEDCFAAVGWVAKNAAELGGDGKRLSVCGDSAGGCLAAVVSLMSRDRQGPQINKQVLLYPVVDWRDDGPPLKYPSHESYGEGFFLTKGVMIACTESYLPQAGDRNHPYASPICAESLEALPEALVITMEYDPLRDEGEEFARRLKKAGVPVTAQRCDGMIHAVLSFPLPLAEIDDIFGLIGRFLNR